MDTRQLRGEAVRRWYWVVAVVLLVASCGTGEMPLTATTAPRPAAATDLLPPAPPAPTTEVTSSPMPRATERSGGLSGDEAATLDSLAKVDAYPLYTMHYYGSYGDRLALLDRSSGPDADSLPWGCSLFAALGGVGSLGYGRNFDWEFSPALLLFSYPPDGYASASMVNLGFLGLRREQAEALLELPSDERRMLLNAPLLPVDGMNEHGLAVGIAAVAPGHMPYDPAKDTIGSLGVVREMLDHARDVDEAVAVLGGYNIDFTGGPPVHYLLADRQGRSVLVEFYQGEMFTIPNETPWHLATNFLLAAVGASAEGRCWRYQKIHQRMVTTNGRLSPEESMELLAAVAQPGTQWSIVYGLSRGNLQVVMGQEYDRPHLFNVNALERPTQ